MTRSFRIALVAACPFPSAQGSQVFVAQLAEHLAGAGHHVHLLTYGQGFEVFGKGYHHHRTPRLPGDDTARSGPTMLKPVLDLMLARALVSLCRRERIEIVHAHNYEAAAAAIAARVVTSVPVLYHSHNLLGDELETYFEGRLAKRLAALAGAALDRTIPPRADRTVALCRYSAERLTRAGCNPEQLAVIPPAVDDDGPLFAGAAERMALGLEPDDFVVGYCGNLDAYQNLEVLAQAFAIAASGEAAPPASGRLRLLLASHRLDPALGARLGRIAGSAASGRVRTLEVHGYAEARAAIAASDLLALPRRLGSGYPIKLLNSMSAAKAVVTAGCGAKVLRDGVDGIVVRDDDPAAMAAAITSCAARPDRGRGLGEAARRSFLATATWQKVLPQIEELYRRLVCPKRWSEMTAGDASRGSTSPGA
ncbi:MAG: glycosyltransferase family 4 protein [Deltaproteobacteria bacterium]|nr:glycosyltransferase family 4 protein [Deltaproteobacteria bacterium]